MHAFEQYIAFLTPKNSRSHCSHLVFTARCLVPHFGHVFINRMTP
ncbi:hypothetical protein FRUB_04458 [Fimbriiglobus ruber]|uniref:Uncharacterized protein n=1 Tax=Fimbriiglobus ruber TaxID=1908690 RepID=A0A225DLP0_9BACT|nr:hypothetical protein FRUB_04458 [Fimbriiglobus ruber]